MSSFFADIADQVCGLDPQYERAKSEIKSAGQNVQLIGIVTAIIGIAFAILGVALLASANPLGLLPIIFGATLLYGGYNTAAVGKNIKEIGENPRNYCSWGGWGEATPELILKQLGKNTVLFNCFIDKCFSPIVHKAFRG